MAGSLYGCEDLIQIMKAKGINISSWFRTQAEAYLSIPESKETLEKEIAESRAKLVQLEVKYEKIINADGWKEYLPTLKTWLVEQEVKDTTDQQLFLRWQYMTSRKDTIDEFKNYLEEARK